MEYKAGPLRQVSALPQLLAMSAVAPAADEHSEVAAVRYDVNVLGTKGPRKMTAIVPAIDADSGRPVAHAPSIHADNGIMDRQAPRRSSVTHRMAVCEMGPLLYGDLHAVALLVPGNAQLACHPYKRLMSAESPPEQLSVQQLSAKQAQAWPWLHGHMERSCMHGLSCLEQAA